MSAPDETTYGLTNPGTEAGVVLRRQRPALQLPLAFWLAAVLIALSTLLSVKLTMNVLQERVAVEQRISWIVSVLEIHEALGNNPEDDTAWLALRNLRDEVKIANPAIARPLVDALAQAPGLTEGGTVKLAFDSLQQFVVTAKGQVGARSEALEQGWSSLHLIVVLAIAQSLGLLALLIALYRRGNSATETRRAMRRTLAELDEARQRAEAESRAKSRFLADVSHEIRTPMNGVIGVTELLLGEQITLEQRSHLETVQGSGRALMRILDDLLDMSKIDAGVLELACEPFDLHGLVRHRVALNRAAARARGLRFACIIDADVPRFLRGDPVRIGQVLGNLVDNAVKFTEEGEVEVHVRRNWDCVRFEVRDTGPGIPPAVKERLFEPFVRVDGTRHHSGSGLGLSLCKQVVHWMGGELGVETAPGEGAIFWFELDLGEGEPTVEVPFPEADEGHTYEGVRVLVVDDHPINRRVVCAILDKLGIVSDAVVDGTDAVAAVHDGNYDAVLMDIEMPRMNGVDATIAIRRQADPIPIIALTAHAMASTRKACFEAGMDDFLAKPVTMGHLDAVLSRWTKAKRRPVDAA